MVFDMKRWLPVILVLLVASFFIWYNADLEKKANQEFIRERDEKIERLENQINELEDRVDKKILEIVDLKNKIEDLENQDKADDLSEELHTNQSLASLVESAVINYELDILIYDNKILRPGLSEEHVLSIFGQPQSDEITIDDGSMIEHMEGVYWKTTEYESFIILYLGDREGESYKVHSFHTQSELLMTSKSIHVGSSLEDLLIAYPTLIIESLPNGEIRYAFPDGEYILSMKFKVEDGVVIEIMYLGYI